jgi:uncharacterized protein (TIGR02145 family)
MLSKFNRWSFFTFTNNFKKINMEKANPIITVTAAFILLFSNGNMSDNIDHPGGLNSDQTSSESVRTQTKSTPTVSKPVQTKPKSTQTVPKPTQSVQTKPKSAQTVQKSTQTKSKSLQKSSKPLPVNKIKDSAGTVRIGTQNWAVANLNVTTFRNGDSIPEAKTNKEWVTAGESGKPAWCYYNNDPANGKKYGKLYNWYAVNDPRGLAPAGWTLSSDADWTKLTYYLGGQEAAGKKMKSASGWIDGYMGTNETGFTGLPGGYRVENGIFLNLGSIGTWWSSEESKAITAVDYYLSLSGSLGRSSSPRQRGESVRCLRN